MHAVNEMRNCSGRRITNSHLWKPAKNRTICRSSYHGIKPG